ncbi:HAMP domain-containing histidine kinase [Sulfurimonas sp. SAG-AH-194-I05]|nr:HAMP domain-containing sensor histidine kinase [Sulfurimonas sp. SAG-AH-194-I05]MDF1875493.1 HAMP domain-containing histidine kinase [Sulfurimonas sp. SAG-AH-194-I05]
MSTYNPKATQELISTIQDLAKDTDPCLNLKIQDLITLYNEQVHINEKITKENKFFLKKWDKRNLLEHDRKDKIIEKQSRLAAMGEMIDAVAHQWKQPLNAISMMMDMLQDDYLSHDINNTYINDLQKGVHLQIDHMVNTLNEFRTFLRPSTKSEKFHISTVIQNVQTLLKDELIAQNLHIHLEIDNEIQIFGNKNEFKHLFINLINNSIDAFNEKKIQSREVIIRCFHKDSHIYIEVQDNAGGIPKNIIKHIFKPNISTKKENNGTGIGLYMTSQIVTKNNGVIHVQNTQDGALFIITLREYSF